MPRLRLFAYGTLQPMARTCMGDWIERRLLASGASTIAGRIFAVRGGDGWFPVLVAAKSSSQRVCGTLCDLDLRPGELALLDRYEGAEYRRRAVPVRTAGGARVATQSYLWRIALPADARAIPSGDFLEWLGENRLRAFSTPRNGI